MVEVYGAVPPYSGRGRPPTCKQPGSDWQYLQMVKIRNEQGRLLAIEERVIFGDEETVTNLLGQYTGYIDRTHLSMRHFNARLTRKTLAFSKKLSLHQAAAALQDAVYNFVRPLKTLRLECFDDPGRRWQPRTPAMAANLVDSIWTVKELLTAIPLPNLVNTWPGDYPRFFWTIITYLSKLFHRSPLEYFCSSLLLFPLNTQE